MQDASALNDQIKEKTIHHAQHIISHFGSLEAVDLPTADSTAALVNERKISQGLLIFLTSASIDRPRKTANVSQVASARQSAECELVKGNYHSEAPLGDEPCAAESVAPPDDDTIEVSDVQIIGSQHQEDQAPRLSGIGRIEAAEVLQDNVDAEKPSTETGSQTVDADRPGPLLAERQPNKQKIGSGTKPKLSLRPKRIKSVKKIPRHVSVARNHRAARLDGISEGKNLAGKADTQMGENGNQIAPETDQRKSEGPQGQRPITAQDVRFDISCLVVPESLPDCLACNSLDRDIARIASSLRQKQSELRKLIEAQEFRGESETQIRSEYGSISVDQDLSEQATYSGWAYSTDTFLDEMWVRNSVWLYPRPETYFRLQELPTYMTAYGPKIRPAKVSQEHSGCSEPVITFDRDTVVIVPHSDPWPDIRSNIAHPDFLGPIRLTEYQACEDLGYFVWRFDRQGWTCRLPECNKFLLDTDPATTICPGCGPCTEIRYCSLAHLFQDIRYHWVRCGDLAFLIQAVLDMHTMPKAWQQMCPMITGQGGYNSFALHRQKVYAATSSQGHYTLFEPIAGSPVILSWPRNDGVEHALEMDRRIERLLNAAFLNVHKHVIISYLLRTLSTLVQNSSQYSTRASKERLRIQFEAEFGYVANDYDWTLLCECEWLRLHNEEDARHRCSFQRKRSFSYCSCSQATGTGMRRRAVSLENRHWILRAWQTQHPIEKDWKARAKGMGFAGDLYGTETHCLGPGQEGWTAPGHNMCD